MGNRVQGVRGTGVWGTWAMGHMADGVHWHNNARSRSRCQNLRLPYFFLISELNTCVILMFEYSFQSLGPPLQESELKLPLGASKAPKSGQNMSKNCRHWQFLDTFWPFYSTLEAF